MPAHHPDLPIESMRLKNTIKSISEYIEQVKEKELRFQREVKYSERRTEHGFITEQVLQWDIQDMQMLEFSLKSPYFARLDCYLDDAPISIYIGKHTFSDDQYGIVGWRSPVCKAFYEDINGFYQPHHGWVGIKEIKLKRHIDNLNGKIIKLFDTVNQYEQDWAPTGDSYLMTKLDQGASPKMKDIVETIQSHQDKVIREDISKAYVIQGIAGSGKTVVALHRLAYLIYTYKLKQDEVLVIGPNKVYLSYISEVLPSLGEVNIPQKTIEQFTGSEELAHYYSEKVNDGDFQDLYNKYAAFIEQEEKQFYRASLPLTLEYMGKTKTYPITKRLSLTPYNEREKLYYQNYRNNIEYDIKEYFDSNESYDAFVGKYGRKYFFPSIEINTLIKKFIDQNGILSKNDFCGLIILFEKYLNGIKLYQHIVIDEAQDLSPFAIYGLTECLAKENSITILGDVCQRLSGKGFAWQDLDFIKNQTLVVFRHSYRSTDNIINFTNVILSKILDQNEFENYSPIPIGRKRSVPHIMGEKYSVLDLLRIANNEFNIIAIICKDNQECKSVYHDIVEHETRKVQLISDRSQTYEKGIVVISVELAKGLEFDYVIIPDLSQYDPNNVQDNRLLYTATSRSMHKLVIRNRHSQDHYLLNRINLPG